MIQDGEWGEVSVKEIFKFEEVIEGFVDDEKDPQAVVISKADREHHSFPETSPVPHQQFHLRSQVKSLSAYSLDLCHLGCTNPEQNHHHTELYGDTQINVHRFAFWPSIVQNICLFYENICVYCFCACNSRSNFSNGKRC